MEKDLDAQLRVARKYLELRSECAEWMQELGRLTSERAELEMRKDEFMGEDTVEEYQNQMWSLEESIESCKLMVEDLKQKMIELEIPDMSGSLQKTESEFVVKSRDARGDVSKELQQGNNQNGVPGVQISGSPQDEGSKEVGMPPSARRNDSEGTKRRILREDSPGEDMERSSEDEEPEVRGNGPNVQRTVFGGVQEERNKEISPERRIGGSSADEMIQRGQKERRTQNMNVEELQRNPGVGFVTPLHSRGRNEVGLLPRQPVSSVRRNRIDALSEVRANGVETTIKQMPKGLPTFRNSEDPKTMRDAEEFLERFERICRAQEIPQSRWASILGTRLENVDARWLEHWVANQLDSGFNVYWSDVSEVFLNHFKSPNAEVETMAQLTSLKYQKNGAQRYADKFKQLADKLEMSPSSPIALYHFKQGLPEWMRNKVTMTVTASRSKWDFNMLGELIIGLEAEDRVQQTVRRGTAVIENEFGGRCFHCNQRGHKISECPQKQNKDRQSKQDEATLKKKQEVRDISCFKCRKKGHFASNCPELKKPSIQLKRASADDSKDGVSSVSAKKVASDNVSIAEGGSISKKIPPIVTPCYLNGEKVMAFVDSGSDHSFVSINWINKYHQKIIPLEGTIKLAIDGQSVPRIGYLEAATLENGKHIVHLDLEVANLHGDEEILIGRDLFEPLGFYIGGVPFAWPQSPPTVEVKPEKKRTEPVPLSNVDSNGIAQEWKQVLADNEAIPSTSVCKLPGAELALETVGEPVFRRQYPIPQAYHEDVTRVVEEWKANGVVVDAPMDCKWNHPLVASVNPHKPGVRVCLDARGLNEVMARKPDSRLPDIRMIQDTLGNFEWITTLDLAAAYHQFPLRKEDQEKTAFTWQGRQYMFTKVPFGLNNMAAHMQNHMERLLSSLGYHPFQDDVPISTKKGGDHVQDVLKALEALTYKAGLKLKLSKCKFFQTEAKVLGSILTRDGILMDPLKTKAILNWNPPVDGKAMQRFLGAVNWNRSFSHEFAELTAPLEEHRNDKEIQWTPELLNAFDKVKKLIASNLKLRHVDWSKTIYLTTDVSLIAGGAWLGQMDENQVIQPVLCISKKLTPTQRRWSTTKRELWMLMWSMQKLRHYLLGRRFVARVDHKPLVSMMRKKLNILIEGWLDTILKYDFIVEYIPGPENVLADALSRQYDGLTVSKVSESPQLNSLDIEEVMLLEANKRGKKIPTAEEKKQLIEQAHALGHFSVEKMYRQLWEWGWWWPKMRHDLKEVVGGCIDCLRFNIVKEGFHPLQSVEANAPWDHIEIDLIGPVPQSLEGHSWILTIVDVMSSYVVLCALKTKDMDEVARHLWAVFCSFGTPKIIQSDRGPEFVNLVMKQLTTLYGIDHRLITAYHPRANGLVERNNKEVSKILKKRMHGASAHWQQQLPLVQLSLNLRYVERIGSSPYTVMFGRAFNGFKDFSAVEPDSDYGVYVAKQLEKHKELQELIWPAIVERTHGIRQDRNQQFNNNEKIVKSLSPGTQVMALDQTRASKWDPVYEGPFTVIKQDQGGAYVLQDADGQILKRKMTINMLKPLEFPVSDDGTSSEEGDIVHLEVKKILDHKQNSNGSGFSYLVKWKDPKEPNSWVKETSFDDIAIIKRYWKDQQRNAIRKKEKKKKSRKSEVTAEVNQKNELKKSKSGRVIKPKIYYD
jgi:transposase InsO family protein